MWDIFFNVVRILGPFYLLVLLVTSSILGR
jgi:UPF0716 family protein affecting phage T7 exclusion